MTQSGWFRGKTITEEECVAEVVDDSAKKYPRFEEAWEGLKWLLARTDLETWKKNAANGMEYHLYKMEGTIEGVPDITIVFSANDDEINILGIKVEDEEVQPAATVTEIHKGSQGK